MAAQSTFIQVDDQRVVSVFPATLATTLATAAVATAAAAAG